MHDSTSAHDLLQRWHRGDQSAATELYERYSRRLLLLASSLMGEKLRRRVTPDDVVQSAFLTFFRRADQWHFEADRPAALWHLLVRITVNKVRSQAAHFNAKRRDAAAEVSLDGSDFQVALVMHDPTPAEAAVFAEELEQAFAGLAESEAATLELAIRGYTASEIATRVGRSRWTVRRTLDHVGHRLLQRLMDGES